MFHVEMSHVHIELMEYVECVRDGVYVCVYVCACKCVCVCVFVNEMCHTL